MEELAEDIDTNTTPFQDVADLIVRFLRDDDERIRELASSILQRRSEKESKVVLRQFRNLLNTLKWYFDIMKHDEIISYSPVTNLIITMGNLAYQHPELSSKIIPLVTRALNYPIFRPQDLTNEKNLFYIAVITVLGRIGSNYPYYVDRSIPMVFKCFIETFRYDSWKRESEYGQGGLRSYAKNTLIAVGQRDPNLIVPRIIPGLNDDDDFVVIACNDILWSFQNNPRNLVTALLNSLDNEKQTERLRATEFIVKLGKNHPRYVIPLLGLALLDERKYVKGYSASALGSLLPSHPEFIRSITPMLVDSLLKETDNEQKQSMVDTLTIISFIDRGAFENRIPQIVQLLRDDHYFVRWRMAQIVKNIGVIKPRTVVDALPYLIEGLDDVHLPVQQKCKEALDALKVDRFDYQHAIRNLERSILELKNVERTGSECEEARPLLRDAVYAVREYRFSDSVELSSKVLDQLEAPGMTSYDVGPVSAPSFTEPGFIEELMGKVEEPPLPPPPDEFVLPAPMAFSTPEGIKTTEESSGTGIDEVLLMTTYGILLEHYVASKKSKVDEDILASMLVAVKSFITDSFDLPEEIGGGKIQLNNIDLGDFSVVISNGKYLTMVAVTTSGNKKYIFNHITKCVEELENRYSQHLENWDGDMGGLEDLIGNMRMMVL